jgi:hypothetical protein
MYIIITMERMERVRFPRGHLNISFIFNNRVTLI